MKHVEANIYNNTLWYSNIIPARQILQNTEDQSKILTRQFQLTLVTF